MYIVAGNLQKAVTEAVSILQIWNEYRARAINHSDRYAGWVMKDLIGTDSLRKAVVARINRQPPFANFKWLIDELASKGNYSTIANLMNIAQAEKNDVSKAIPQMIASLKESGEATLADRLRDGCRNASHGSNR